MSTQPEEAAATLESPDDTDDDTPPAADGGALFDKSQYEREDLQISKIDGQSVDKIRVKFSGSVMLDRSDPADVALYNRLLLGEDCELRVAGNVSGSGGGKTTNKDGDLDAIVGQKTVTVDTVWVLTPEEL